MALRTTTAAGDWAAGGTWVGGLIPGNGDTAQLDHNVTVSTSVTVGASPAAGTVAVTVGESIILTVSATGTLISRGDLRLTRAFDNNPLEQLIINGVLEFDSSQAASPSTTRYRLVAGTANDGKSGVAVVGTVSQYAEIRSNTGGACWQMSSDGFVSTGYVRGKYFKLIRMGDASNEAYELRPPVGAAEDFEDGVFDTCGMWDRDGEMANWLDSKWRRVNFKNSLGTYNLGLFSGSGVTSALRIIDDCVFDKGIFFSAVQKYNVTNNLFYLPPVLSGGPAATWSGNLIRKTSQSPFTTSAVTDLDSIYLKDGAVGNPHGVQADARTMTIDGAIFINEGNTDQTGDQILLPTPGSSIVITVKRCLKLANANGTGTGTFLSALGNVNVGLVIEHNTWHIGSASASETGGVRMGEAYDAHAGMIQSFKSNLAWDSTLRTDNYLLSDRSATPVADVVTAANANYNSIFNAQAGSEGKGYNLNITGSPGANDVAEGDPQFVDSARRITTWDTSLGGPGTVANALAEMMKRNDPSASYNSNYTIAALRTYIRAGFMPQRAALLGAGHDGLHIGAISPPPITATHPSGITPQGNLTMLVIKEYAANGTFTAPLTGNVDVECWGSGGAGGGATSNPGTGGGGAGGTYAKSVVAVILNTGYAIVVGAARAGTTTAAGQVGNNSTFASTTVVAQGGGGGGLGSSTTVGGSGGAGSIASSTGTTRNPGGNGAQGGASGGLGGAGGGGAGSTGAGGNASGGTAGTGTTIGGGSGGAGVATNSAGSAGSNWGGGGSGGRAGNNTDRAGGTGQIGHVRVSYTIVVSGGIPPMSLTSTITAAGVVARRGVKSLLGTITGVGVVVRRGGKALAGSVTGASALARQAQKVLAGSVTGAGSLATLKTKLVALASTITAAGTLVKRAGKVVTGSITAAGITARATTKALLSSITPAGTLSSFKTRLMALASSITGAGSLAKRINRIHASAVTLAGTLAKLVAKSLPSSLTLAGALATLKTRLLALASSIASTSTLRRLAGVVRASSVPVAGVAPKEVRKGLTGSSTPAGALAAIKAVLLSLASTINLAATLRRVVGQTLAGASTPAGTVVKQTARALGSAITAAGILAQSRLVIRAVASTILPTGALGKAMGRALAGIITLGGTVRKQTAKGLADLITLAGTVIPALVQAAAALATRFRSRPRFPAICSSAPRLPAVHRSGPLYRCERS